MALGDKSIFCYKCGAAVNKNTSFCVECGANILLFENMSNLELLRKAEADDVNAMYKLAGRYMGLDGGNNMASNMTVPERVDEGIMWLEKAADKGHAAAQWQFAWTLYKYNEILNDPQKAFFHCKGAAEKNIVPAQILLSDFYREGFGVSVDMNKAFYWMKKAASSGSAETKLALVPFYVTGSGVAVDIEKAKQLCEEAIDGFRRSGNTEALNNAEYVLKRLSKEEPGGGPPYPSTLGSIKRVLNWIATGWCIFWSIGTIFALFDFFTRGRMEFILFVVFTLGFWWIRNRFVSWSWD